MTNLSDKYKNNLPFESSNVTTIVSNYTASNNETVFVNSASSALTVTLPASPTQGSKIKVLDIATNSQNNNITVLGNGNNIGGASAYIINTPDSSVEIMYVNAIKGWNVLNEYISITKPQSPTNISVSNLGSNRPYNNGAASISFTPSTAGDPADSYTVVSTPGTYTATGGSSPIVVNGLQSNTSYTFKVIATNAAGSSSESTASDPVIATTIPQEPTLDSASDVGTSRDYNNGAAVVSFTPNATGGSSITGYTVTSSPGGYTASGASSPITITGLQSNTAYTFTVTATNQNGNSNSSSSSEQITATTVPQAPTINSVTHGFEKVSVEFTSNNTGGKAISGYAVTSNPGSVSGSGASSPISVSSLTAGTAYTFTATATNANGTSAASTASSSATPFTASGGTITTYTGYRSHTFTGTSSFTVSGNSAPIEYLVVAGGGGGGLGDGGPGYSAGGGGAGGMLSSSTTISAATHTISIGGGGGANGNNGSNSSLGSIVTSIGGGGGGYGGQGGKTGGSGGGGGQYAGGGAGTAGQGTSGRSSSGYPSGGGGGGAGEGGSSGPKGGNGLSNDFRTGSPIYYAGGGGGGDGTAQDQSGGLGGGGNGGYPTYGNGRNGISAGGANTGGGGGGANKENGAHNGEPGGSGIVVIRYAV